MNLSRPEPSKKVRVLLEMRPALDGFAGIPQETRLLFRALCLLDAVAVEGLLQKSLYFLSPGMGRDELDRPLADSTRLDRYSRVVLALDSRPTSRRQRLQQFLRRWWMTRLLTVAALRRPQSTHVALTVFQSRHFEEYIWQALFAKTLPGSDYALVTGIDYRICTVPWNTLQTAGLSTRKRVDGPVYPRLDTTGMDIFIAQTPYPGRVADGTTLVVRYHDALSLFMPHAFANKVRHQAVHFNALLSNVRSGAFFACVSEATRQDLLSLFPELSQRSVTIHNMVSHHYFPEASAAGRARDIIRNRLSPAAAARPEFRSLAEQDAFYLGHLGGESFTYLLVVSTVEPRKNHRQLVAAWERIRSEIDTPLRLVIVGGLGWDTAPILEEMRSGLDQGQLFVLSGVPAADLRVLYHHAALTVCPSLAEGFDFSGVEAMQCGGIVLASDIAVHHEIFADAAVYFDPHVVDSLVDALQSVLFGPDSGLLRDRMRARGREIARRYLPETIIPQWAQFLERVVRQRHTGEATGS